MSKTEVNVEKSVFDELNLLNTKEVIEKIINKNRKYPVSNPDTMDRQEKYDIYGYY